MKKVNPESVDSKENNKGDLKKEPSLENHDPLARSNFPLLKKILVTYDDKHKMDIVINYSVYLSTISNAEVTFLHIIEEPYRLYDISLDISNQQDADFKLDTDTAFRTNNQISSTDIEDQMAKSIQRKINTMKTMGLENAFNYKTREGSVVDEIVKEINESEYDLIILSSYHFDSWIKSLFSFSRRVISKVDIPVLLLS